MAENSLYVAVRSKTGKGRSKNSTNVYIDGIYHEESRMAAGYENQFSCRKGVFGISDGGDTGAGGVRALAYLSENKVNFSGWTEEEIQNTLLHARQAAGEKESVKLRLLCLQESIVTIAGIGALPIRLLRGHHMSMLEPAEEDGEFFIHSSFHLKNKDRLLLCTQEIIDSIDPPMLQTILDGRGEPNQIAGDLLREAEKNGAVRDLTVAVVFCDAVEEIPGITGLETEEELEAQLQRVFWYKNPKMLGVVSAACVCLIAVSSITFASVLKKRKVTPAAGGYAQSSRQITTESAGFAPSAGTSLPYTTQMESTVTEEPSASRRPRTTARRTTRAATTERETTTEKETKPSTTQKETTTMKDPESTTVQATGQ